jgi:hypothetical protein
MSAMGRKRTSLAPSINEPSKRKPDDAGDDQSGERDMGRKAFAARKIGHAIAECIYKHQEQADRHADTCCCGATPFSAATGATLISVCAHIAPRVAACPMSAMGRKRTLGQCPQWVESGRSANVRNEWKADICQLGFNSPFEMIAILASAFERRPARYVKSAT